MIRRENDTGQSRPDEETRRGDTDKDLQDRLRELAPLVNLLDQAREAVVRPSGGQLDGSGRNSYVQPPSQLDDFELLSPIGRGGMGVVYEARQLSLDRIVAIKVLPKTIVPEKRSDSGTDRESHRKLIQRFHTEARAAARLHHPNIVPVFGFGEAAGFYYFVMQRIYGQSLDRWIESHQTRDAVESQDVEGREGASASQPPNNKQRFATVARFGLQAATGLAYAHQEGVLHRDIKPANLLIDEEGTLQIADFGVARIDDSDSLTKTTDVIGTLRYMAPEQIIGESQPQSDVYSLGVTLYELVTGRPAVDDASVRQAILLQQKPKGPESLSVASPDVPLDLRTIIEKAMAPELSRRYGDAAALADDLRRFIDGRAIRARPMTRWERSVRWVRRNQTVSVMASMLIVALALIAVISTTGQVRLTQALRDSEAAEHHARRTAGLANDAMERVFGRFSSSADSTSLDYHTTDFSAPAVDPKTAALLEDLIGYYKSIANQTKSFSGTRTELVLHPGEAWANVGTIYLQLGKHESAIAAYSNALSELGQDASLWRARIENQLGIAHAAIGNQQQAQTRHAEALNILLASDKQIPLPEVTFETARTRLLLARRVRPGMGPQAFPPAEAFRHDPWLSGPRMRGAPGAGPRPGPGKGPGFPPGTRPPFRPGPPPRRPHDPGFGERPTERAWKAAPEDDQEQFLLAIEQLRKLKADFTDSLPVTLLLSNLVRQSLGDMIRANEQADRNAELLELAGELEADFFGKLADQAWAENDAAIAYELVHLLADFNVFRELRPQSLRYGLDRLERALPIVEHLVEEYPNVTAYEDLAVHTALKASTLKTVVAVRDPRSAPDLLRSTRSLLRQALRRQQRLIEKTQVADGYKLWSALIQLRIGDVQLRTHDGRRASQSYLNAMGKLPIDKLISVQPSGNQVSAESPTASNDEAAIKAAALTLLRRLDHAVHREEPALADSARDLADKLASETQTNWIEVSERLAELMDGRDK